MLEHHRREMNAFIWRTRKKGGTLKSHGASGQLQTAAQRLPLVSTHLEGDPAAEHTSRQNDVVKPALSPVPRLSILPVTCSQGSIVQRVDVSHCRCFADVTGAVQKAFPHLYNPDEVRRCVDRACRKLPLHFLDSAEVNADWIAYL
jgi:hypothetical protein